MLKIELKVQNIPETKLAVCLNKFGKSFPFEYTIEAAGATATAKFCLENLSALNELCRRLKHLKGIQFRFSKIEKVSK
jgi:hypothetical protein